MRLVPFCLIALLALACRPRATESSRTKLTNPVPAGPDDYPEVVEIMMKTAQGEPFFCTATFIMPNIILTSAHCFFDEDSRPMRSANYTTPDGKVYQGSFYSPAAYKSENGTRAANISADIGLVVFKNDIAPKVATLASYSSPIGSRITMVGFGDTNVIDDHGAGPKNMSSNIIHDKIENRVEIRGYALPEIQNKRPGIRSVPGNGDSGGAVFDKENRLVGIMASGGILEPMDRVGPIAAFGILIDIRHRLSLQYLADLRQQACGPRG